MSNILRDAAESTIHVAESTLQSVADFVEDAYRHIELPHIALPTRRRSSAVRSVAIALLGLAVVAGVVAMLLRRPKTAPKAAQHSEPKDTDGPKDTREHNGRPAGGAEREAQNAS